MSGASSPSKRESKKAIAKSNSTAAMNVPSASGGGNDYGDTRTEALSREEKEEVENMQQVISSSASLEEVCEANGVSAEQLALRANELRRMDIFQLADVVQLSSMLHFRYLTELVILDQKSITSMVGLSNCTGLEKLWICECSIRKISGLDECSLLKELYLTDNKITKIENINHLSRLKKLWLCNNRLTEIANLDGLAKLTHLNLARNRINAIGTKLDTVPDLVDLNVSDNQIGCFKELLNISRLKQLRSLCFSDPHYGDNPVCRLCNYQTYVLYHLGQISSLDTLSISDESKQLAEATYMKKKMYYNMRIKTLKRNTTNVIRKANVAKQARINQVNMDLSQLIRAQKDIERVLDERKFSPEEEKDEDDDTLHLKLNELKKVIDKKNQQIFQLQSKFASLKAELWKISEDSIRRLMIELETGGNIRLEDGSPNDLWYSSCVDLLLSRFVEMDFKQLDASQVHVKRVARVHNRYLRAKYDLHVERIVAELHKKHERSGNPKPFNTAEAVKSRQEYLFFTETPAMRELFGDDVEILRTVENGFRSAGEYLPMSRHGAVALSNSLAIADLPRVTSKVHGLANQLCGNEPNSGQPSAAAVKLALTQLRKQGHSVPDGKLLVCKVFLGNYDSEHVARNSACLLRKDRNLRRAEPTEPTSFADDVEATSDTEADVLWDELAAPVAGFSSQYDDDSQAPVAAANYFGHHAVYRNRSNHPKERYWYAFDNHLVLPEYLVEFNYHFGEQQEQQQNLRARMAQLNINEEPLTEQEQADLGPLLGPLVRFVAGCRQHTAQLHDPSVKVPKQLFSHASRDADVDEDEVASDNDMHVLQMEPLVAARPKLFLINDKTVSQVGCLSSFNNVVYLNLHGNNLRQIEHLHQCEKLKQLVLSFNEIDSIHGLDNLVHLEKLDLSFNLIKSITGLQGCLKLVELQLNNNLIYKVEELEVLGKFNVHLRHLLLHNNPVCEVKSYRHIVLRKIKGLAHLDHSAVSRHEVKAAEETHKVITMELIRKHSRGGSYISYSGGDAAQGKSNDVEFAASAEELDLSHMRLGRLERLEQLVNLRKALFADNELNRIEGLQHCTLLEELCLEENRIARLENLQQQTFLKKLDLGKNRLAKVENLESLQHLMQLSLEDNEITSLAGLEQLKSLMELYIGNNRVSAIKEVQHLKELPKLIIVDLSGNQLCKHRQYRLYTIYYLRRLKVLDGMGVDTKEVAAAKEQYSGKLTPEFLLDKIGHKYFEHIRELDLSSCRIREVELLSGSDFGNLRILNLDNNLIQDIRGLVSLHNLTVLKLNNNRVEGFLPPEFHSDPAAYKDDGKGIFALPNLEVLQLNHNRVADLAMLCLEHLTKLKVLSLVSNNLKRLTGLDSCYELRELALDKNKIKLDDSTALALQGLVNLRELRIEENGIRSLASLHTLVKLRLLHLGFNRLNDVSEFDKLQSLPGLLELSLLNNPASRKQLYRPSIVSKFPLLRYLDNKEISQEERQRVEILFCADAQQPNINMDESTTASYYSANKATVKMTSINFESLCRLGRPSGNNSSSSSNNLLDHSRVSSNPSLGSVLGVAGRSVASNNSRIGSTPLMMHPSSQQQQQQQSLWHPYKKDGVVSSGSKANYQRGGRQSMPGLKKLYHHELKSPSQPSYNNNYSHRNHRFSTPSSPR